VISCPLTSDLMYQFVFYFIFFVFAFISPTCGNKIVMVDDMLSRPSQPCVLWKAHQESFNTSHCTFTP